MLTHNALGTTHSLHTERMEFSISQGLKVDLAEVTATGKGDGFHLTHNTHVCIHSLLHSFTDIKYLLCARHCSRHRGHSSNQEDKVPVTFLGGKTDHLQIKAQLCSPLDGEWPSAVLPFIGENGLGNRNDCRSADSYPCKCGSCSQTLMLPQCL